MAADAFLARQVEAMAGYGVPARDIAIALDIDRSSLENDYRKELDSAAIRANSRVAENLFRKATGEGREAVTAAIFWLKTRAGWKETSVHELAARPRLTDEQINERLAYLMRSIEETDPGWIQRILPVALRGGD